MKTPTAWLKLTEPSLTLHGTKFMGKEQQSGNIVDQVSDEETPTSLAVRILNIEMEASKTTDLDVAEKLVHDSSVLRDVMRIRYDLEPSDMDDYMRMADVIYVFGDNQGI